MKLVSQPQSRVEKWGRWEAAFRSGQGLRDPYADCGVEATFTGPDSAERRFWGFYDGGGCWRLRFMPDKTGPWRFEVRREGKELAQGGFECVDSDRPGVLRPLRANPAWFGLDGERPILLRSFHAGDRFFARNWPEDRRIAFLDWLQGQGYNMLSVASHLQNRQEAGRGLGWSTPRLWPLDACEFRRMEDVLDDLERRRIYVFPFAGFFGREANNPNSQTGRERFLRYTLARLAPYWNLLFNVAGPEPLLPKSSFATKDDLRALGKRIAELDPFGHPLSVHNRTGDDEFRDEDYTNYGILQGPKTTDLKALGQGLLQGRHPRKPLYAQETLWSRNIHGHPDYGEEEIRRNSIVIIMSAAFLNFGDMRGDSSTGFSGTLDLADRDQRRHDILRGVWDLFEALPYHRMTPRQDLVDNGFCLAEEEGGGRLVYLGNGGRVRLRGVDGAVRGEWINMRETSDRREARPAGQGPEYEAPDGGDWLLWLRRG